MIWVHLICSLTLWSPYWQDYFYNTGSCADNPVLTQAFPLFSFCMYLGGVFKSVSVYQECSEMKKDPFLKWVPIECMILCLAFIGTTMWLLFRQILRLCGRKEKVSFMNNLNKDSNDAITRHHWEIQLLQCAFLSFAGSMVIYMIMGTENLVFEMLLASIAGWMQFCEHFLLTFFSRKNRRWLISIDLYIFFAFGFCILPLVAWFLAITNGDPGSNSYKWSFVLVGSSAWQVFLL